MSTYNTLLGLRGLGVDGEILSYPLSPNDQLRGVDVPIHYAPSPCDRHLLYSPRYRSTILSLGDYDIYHAQGVWQYPTYAMASVARERGRPYLITPRGMLYPQDIAKSNRLLKRLSLRFMLLEDLNRAATVQVTCVEEMQHCRELGVTSPIAVIANPVEIINHERVEREGRFRVGYLGRLSPRKRVEILIYALSQLEALDMELVIIGGGDGDYEQFLRSEVSRLGLKRVRFTGLLSGEAKDRALSSLSLLVLPSEFENLGNVILEALVHRVPCIATTGSPWSELQSHRCGWWVEPTQRAITEALREGYHTPEQELGKMGERGYELVRESYSIEAIATKMRSLYEWILGEDSRPDFVYLD